MKEYPSSDLPVKLFEASRILQYDDSGYWDGLTYYTMINSEGTAEDEDEIFKNLENSNIYNPSLESVFYYGFYLFKFKCYNDAFTLFNNYIIENNINPYAYYMIGVLYEIMKKHKESLENYRKCLEISETNKEYDDLLPLVKFGLVRMMQYFDEYENSQYYLDEITDGDNNDLISIYQFESDCNTNEDISVETINSLYNNYKNDKNSERISELYIRILYKRYNNERCINETMNILEEFKDSEIINKLGYEMSIILNNNELFELSVKNLKEIFDYDIWKFYKYVFNYINSPFIRKQSLNSLKQLIMIIIQKYPVDIYFQLILVEILILPEINQLQSALNIIQQLLIIVGIPQFSLYNNSANVNTDCPIEFKSRILALFVFIYIYLFI